MMCPLRSTPQRIYRAVQPLSTHFRRGTCAEARCPQYLLGWKTLIDETTPFGQAQARYIRKESGRNFKEERTLEGLTAFVFEAGQKCLRQHQVFIDRPAFALIGGDEVKALNPANPAHVTAMQRQNWYGEDWIDDNKEHLYKLRQRQKQG